jgi:hypothetical protein
MCVHWRQAVVIAGCAPLSACILEPDDQHPNVPESPDLCGTDNQILG